MALREFRDRFSLRSVPTLLRIAQLFFGLLTLALASAAIGGEYKYWEPGAYNEADALGVSSGVLTVCAVSFTMFAPRGKTGWDIAHLAVECIMNVLWFATFITLAAMHSGEYCPRSWQPNYCDLGKAAAAFAAVTWVLFAITTYYTIRDFNHNRLH